MIVIEFLIFVVSSGVFYSERFHRHLLAVLTAGIVAAGSSLLFFWHLAEMWRGNPETPPTQIVRQIVERPAPAADANPTAVGKPHACGNAYPTLSRQRGEAGTTKLAFKVLSDGTVAEVAVEQSSGFARLDAAAEKCVSTWHYRPAMRGGKIVDLPWEVTVVWSLGQDTPPPKRIAAPQAE
jgi:TonB family protein